MGRGDGALLLVRGGWKTVLLVTGGGGGGGKREGISAGYRTREGITPAVNFTKITGLSGSFQNPTMCALSCHLLYLNGAIFIT